MDISLKIKYDELKKALQGRKQDFAAAQSLVDSGLDVNDRNLFDDVVFNISNKAKALKAAEFFVKNGFDSIKHGPNIIGMMAYGTRDRLLFDLTKLFLSSGMDQLEDDYIVGLLKQIGTEESFSICCEQDIKKNNLYYATYELFDAVRKNKPFSGIGLWEDCIGMRVEKVCALSKAREILREYTSEKTEFLVSLYLVCDKDAVVVECRPNIFIKSWPEVKRGKKQVILDDSFAGIIGAVITLIKFGHKTFKDGTTHYHSPIITLFFDNGYELQFSCNLDEVPVKQAQLCFSVIKPEE